MPPSSRAPARRRREAGKVGHVVLGLVTVLVLAGGWLLARGLAPGESPGSVQQRCVDRLLAMAGDDFQPEEAALRDLVERAHERLEPPAADDAFDPQAYAAALTRSMSQVALDDRDPDLASRCSLLQVEISEGIAR